MNVQRERLVLAFKEPGNSFVGLFKTQSDMLVNDCPNEKINIKLGLWKVGNNYELT